MAFFPPNAQDLEPPPPPPPRPASQKAATMAVQPSEDNIQMFLDVSGIESRDVASRYLKAKNNNLEQALDAFLNGEDVDKQIQATQWDESAWSTNREGELDYNTNLRPLTSSAAPTRGPSPAPPYSQPTTRAEEEEQMRRAMAESSQAAGMTGYQQESGVVGADGTERKLQPATRDHYETNSWAVVPFSGSQASEIVPDADVDDRKHEQGKPRFLKHLANEEYLSALLTICHSIPLAREAFLLRDYVKGTYGSNVDWWKGTPISLPKIVNVADGSPDDGHLQRAEELTMEVQRLMAALDASDRSYVGVGALTQVDHIRLSSIEAGGLSGHFLNKWAASARAQCEPGEDSLTRIFRTVIKQAHLGEDDEVEVEDPEIKELVDLQVNIPEGSQRELSQELDNLLWGVDGACNAIKNSCINPVADILAIHVSQQNSAVNKQLRVVVPSELFVDKYLEDNFAATIELRKQLVSSRQRMTKIEDVEAKLTTWPHPTKNKIIDPRLLLRHTLGFYNGENRRKLEREEQGLQGGLPNGDVQIEEQSEHNKEVAGQLERLIASIDVNLAKLAVEKEKTLKTLADLSKSSVPNPSERYTLRGVSTKPNVTYVLRPKNVDPQLIDMDERADGDGTPEGMQWWRIDYDTLFNGPKISTTKMSDFDVLRAVELEHSSALLVYASERALQDEFHNPDLPEPLESFVRKDNQFFLAEQVSTPKWNLRGHQAPPQSPAMAPTRARQFTSDDLLTLFQKAAVRDEGVERTVPITYSMSADDEYNSSSSMVVNRRRDSGDSTMVQPDYDIDDPDDDDPHRVAEHASYGLGYDLKPAGPQPGGGGSPTDEDAPVHEIILDDSSNGHGSGAGGGTEMHGVQQSQDDGEVRQVEDAKPW